MRNGSNRVADLQPIDPMESIDRVYADPSGSARAGGCEGAGERE
jgi:hypothetical protein